MNLFAVLAFASMVLAKGAVISIANEAQFDQVVGGSRAALVKFFAPWCGHCKQIAPTYIAAAKQCENIDVAFVEVNGDNNRWSLSKYSIRGYPTLLIFPAGSKKGIPFNGSRTVDGICSFVKRQLQIPTAKAAVEEAQSDEANCPECNLEF